MTFYNKLDCLMKNTWMWFKGTNLSFQNCRRNYVKFMRLDPKFYFAKKNRKACNSIGMLISNCTHTKTKLAEKII